MNVRPLLRLLRLDPCSRHRRRAAALERRLTRLAVHAAYARSRFLVRQPGFALSTSPRFRPGARVFVRPDGTRLAAVSGLHLVCLFPLPPVAPRSTARDPHRPGDPRPGDRDQKG